MPLTEEIVANPNWSRAIAIVQAMIAATMAALAFLGLRDFARAPVDPIGSADFWFGLFGLGGAVLAACFAGARFAGGKRANLGSGLAFPYWLAAPLVFMLFAAILSDERGDTVFGAEVTTLCFDLMAAAAVAITLAGGIGQWQLWRAAGKAKVAQGPITLAPPRYPLVVFAVCLLLAEPGFAAAILADISDLKALVFLAMAPLIAVLLLWKLRTRPKGIGIDAEGVTGLAEDKIQWRDLSSARTILVGPWVQTRHLQLLFKDAQVAPRQERNPEIPEAYSAPGTITIGIAQTYLPSRLLADLVNARIAAYQREVGES